MSIKHTRWFTRPTAITIVEFNSFIDLIVLERISTEDTERISAISDTMSFDEYSGYSPTEQRKYKAIKEILSQYKQPASRVTIKQKLCRHCQTICSIAKKNFTCKNFTPTTVDNK